MHTRLLTAPLLALAVLLAACGSGATSPTAAPATATPATEAPATEAPSTEAPSAAPSSAAAGVVTVALADTSLGKVVVDGKGMTLYAFTPDDAGDSTCYDDCEKAWPVLAGAGVTAGEGLAAADFGTTTRKDGSTQITLKGWPLYYFAGDKAAGDVAGQGLGGKWYVVAADGTLVK